MMYDFDIVLKEIGYFGRYQVFLVIATIWSMVPIGSNLSAVVFLAYEEPSRCVIANVDGTGHNLTEQSLQNLFIPWDTEKQAYSSCSRFATNFVPNCTNDNSCQNITSFNNTMSLNNNSTSSVNQIVGCSDGWFFTRIFFTETISTEWDLVCERRSLSSLSTALFCFGMLLGSLCGGSLADKYGRVRTMFCTTVLNVIVAISCAFSQNFTMFAILRCILGASATATQIAMVVYTVEIVGVKYRTWIGLQVGVFSGLGYMFLSILAYIFRHWRTLQISLGLTFIPFVLIAPFVPESPRLLFAQGKFGKAKKICRQMASRNGRKLNENIWKEAEIYSNEVHKTYSPLDLCQRRRVFVLLIQVTTLWFVNSLIFFCLSFNVGGWSGNPFLNQALSGFVEFIACLLVVPVTNKFGRRLTLIMSLITAGTLILLVEILKLMIGYDAEGLGIVEVCLLLLAKFAISGSFNLMFLYTAELFPTHIRNTAVGVASVGGRAASIISPFLLQLQSYVTWLLPVVLAGVALCSSLVVIRLPETKGCSMLATMEDAEQFYKTHNKKVILINNNPEKLKLDAVRQISVSSSLMTEGSSSLINEL